MSTHPWSVWMSLSGIMQCPDCAAVCGGTAASQRLLGSSTSFQLLILPLHFSVCFSSGLRTKAVWTERAELSLIGAFLLISPRTALSPHSWLPSSLQLLFPSLGPPRIYEWRPLDPFCNKPWMTPLKRGVGFGNNVKNCEILPVWGAQPSFGQWIMALAKMFSLQSLLTSLEEWKLLPAKIGSFSASSASMALPHSLVVWFCILPLLLFFPSHCLSQSLDTWTQSEALLYTRTGIMEMILWPHFLSPCYFSYCTFFSSDHTWSDTFNPGASWQGEHQLPEWSRRKSDCGQIPRHWFWRHVWVNWVYKTWMWVNWIFICHHI